MLVLGRKRNESIIIDGGIEITILEIAGNRVRLGVKAPDNVRVLRDELRPKVAPVSTDEFQLTGPTNAVA